MNQAMNSIPKVSVGIPTFKRPEMLRRALLSLAQQDFQDIEIIIGDNDPSSTENERMVAEFRQHFPSLIYQRHSENIGATANFMFCLEAAKGEYFMWLADDDELFGTGYIQALADILDRNKDAVTAVAQWKLMRASDLGTIQPFRDYQSKYWLLRVFKFAWRADDDFFYGLHRTRQLRNAKMVDYWPINAGVASNLTYTYLVDFVIQGRVIRLSDSNSLWINHAYTVKDHTQKSAGRTVNLRYVARRLNVHWLYAKKVYDKGGVIPAMLLACVSAAALLKETWQIGYKYLRNRVVPARNT